MTTPYSAGTISLTNGSAVVTGIGTAWQTALIAGGTIYVQAAGNPLPILIVDSNTQITAALKWTGATGTYSYALIRDTAHDAQLVANATALARLLAGMEAGTIFKYNAEGDTAGRAFYDSRPKGFAYLDISVNPARLWIKAADVVGNWAGPFSYAQGEQGIPGPAGLVNWRGNYAVGTAYARNEAVYSNGSAFIALQATTDNAPPVLPTTSNAWWSVMAVKGSDGASFTLPERLGPFSAGVADWNLAIETGSYASLPGVLNSPDAEIYWSGFVKSWGSSWLRQTVWSIGGSEGDTMTWQREQVVGEAWTPWYRVLSSQAELDARYAQIANAMSQSQVLSLFNAAGAAPVFAPRAWVNFNGTGTVAIRASGNVSSITDNGPGNYTVNFATALPNGDYGIVATIDPSLDFSAAAVVRAVYTSQPLNTASSCRIFTGYVSPTAVAKEDMRAVNVAIFG